MKAIIRYIKQYFSVIDKKIIIGVSLLTAVIIFINYYFGLNEVIQKNNPPLIKLICWYGVFLFAFSTPYFFTAWFSPAAYFRKNNFRAHVLLAPFIFAVKICIDFSFHFTDKSNWNNYWNHIIYWPALLLIVSTFLFLLWHYFDRQQPFYGWAKKNINWKPYWLMLLIMVPLIVAASMQADFLAVYPKLKTIDTIYHESGLHWWHKLLFELSYGSDFITIELFFRGFLILAFIKWAGKDAILPMACFYCTIHFGKPLGECVSSYFGGMILGIVVYHTRSVLGGLMVHLGIAWMMELGGYLGNDFLTLLK